MGSFELRKDRLGLLLDALYVDLGANADWVGRDHASVSTDTKVGMYTVAAAYRPYEGTRSSADVYAGWRFFDAGLDLGVATDARGRTVSTDLSWGDPILGIRGAYVLSDRWTLRAFLDVGGFDSASDLSWQAYSGAAYAFGEHWEALVGYRYLSILYAVTDRAKLDIDVQGPVFGINYRF